MRAWIAVVGLMLAGSASAQDVGDSVWIQGDVTSVRFVGERTPGPVFNDGARVTVLAVQDGRVRVFSAERFGWVLPSQIVTEPPEGMAPAGAVPVRIP